MKKLTTEEFIKRAKEVHGDKYDYSKTKYVNSGVKVCIICPEHGEFYIIPHAHLGGQGCRKCGNAIAAIKNSESSRNAFIEKAREKHGDKYDYSKVKYVNQHTPVCIICPEHGEYWESPKRHLNSKGCIECSMPNRNLTVEKFIEKAREKHGDKYDYSKVKYVNPHTPVCIICPEHGEFWQEPWRHLAGSGCRRCTEPNFGITTEEFIEKAREKHGDKYDYSKVKCNGTKSKVCIICPEHGEFWQNVGQHLKGQGCPNCYSLRKSYKFNLLKEFESEYAFRAFLETNHINILLMILSNLCENNPKYKPIEKDIEKALKNTPSKNPIKYLEEKYSSMIETEEIETKENVDIDFDDDDALDAIVKTSDEIEQEKEITMADLIKNEKKVVKTLKKIDHMLTPELRSQIMSKYENDKLRAYFAAMETK